MSTLTATQLQQQYIAYFGRPGDPAGIKYWLSSSSGISSAREFADKIYAQDEYKKSTVGTKSTEEQVNQLYVNLFGRQADASGLLYWTGEIENGSLSLSNIAYDLIAAANNPLEANSAQGALDAKALANKVSAAEAFTTSLESDTAGILAYQPESTDPWKSGASFASAVSFIATATDSNAPTASDVSAAVATMSSAKPSTGSAASAQTFKFTTSTDALVGDSGNDTFTGVLQAAGATGTTAQPGDNIEGGEGTDTFTVSAAGAFASADYTLSAISTTGVEKVFLSNFETSTYNTTVDTALMSGVTTIGLSSSSATGDTIFSGLSSLTDAEMRNGSGDLTVTYNSDPISGASDTQKLTLSSLSNGTFTADGIETLAITTELVKSKVKDVTGSALTKITVDGAAKLTVTDALTEKTIDGSASSGGLDLTLGTTTAQTVTGGSGDDVIRGVTGVASTDTISGGSGTDTLTLEVGNETYDGKTTGSNKQLSKVSGFETLEVATTHANATVELDNVTGVKTLVADDTSVELVIAGANNDINGTVTLTIAGNTYVTGTLDLSSNTASVDHGIIATALADKINAVDDGTTAVATNASLNIRRSDGDILTATTSVVNHDYTRTQSADETISFTKAAGDEVLDIYKAGTVKLRLADPSGTEDVANINLKTNTDNKATAQTVADVDVANTETVNLSVTGMKDGVLKTLSALSGDATLTTLNITGDSDFELTDIGTDNTKLATVDASTFTGDLTLKGTTTGATFGQTITTGVGNDTLAFDSGELTEHDVVDLGDNTVLSSGKMGKDTVTHTGNHGSAVTQQILTVSNVEDLQLTAAAGVNGAATFYLDASKFTNVDQVSLAGGSGTAKFTNLDTNTAIGLGVAANDFSGTLNVALADETGTSDSITLNESSALDAATGITFKSTGIETLNFVGTTDASNARTTTFTFGDNAPSTITATKGQAADTLALGTLNKTTTVVDASAYDGILSITGTAADVAMTVSAKMGSASGAHSITTNNKNDTFNLGEYGTAAHTLDGGSGTDVLNTTLTTTASDFTNVAGFETLNLTIKNETDAGSNDANEETGLQAAKTINVLGGNSLSTFTIATAMLSSTTTTLFDASTFQGKTEITLEEDEFANTLTLKGGANAKDKVTLNVDAASTTNKIGSMTGFELLSITTDDGDLDGIIDLANVDGLTEIAVSYTTATNDDGMTIKNVDTGVKIKATPTHADDAITLTSTDSGLSDTTFSIDLVDSANSVAYIFDVNAEKTEVLNLNQLNDHGGNDGFNLAGVTADTGLTTTVNVEGLATTLKLMSTSVTTVDGTKMTGGLTIAAADRTDAAMTITGGLGDDALTMEAAADVIDGGLGTDTLTVAAPSGIGGFGVDLNQADQVTTFGGVANTSVQKGFEKVDMSGVTGNYGADVTGFTAKANTLDGSGQDDVLRGGSKVDTLTGRGGDDTFIGGAGADTFVVWLDSVDAAPDLNNFSNIVDYVSGTDTIAVKNAAGTKITLAVQNAAAAQSAAGRATITSAGVATFNNADDTFAERLVALSEGINDSGDDGGGNTTGDAGDTVQFTHDSKTYLYVEDGTLGVTTNDIVIRLDGLTTSGAITYTSGEITALA